MEDGKDTTAAAGTELLVDVGKDEEEFSSPLSSPNPTFPQVRLSISLCMPVYLLSILLLCL